MADNYGGIAEQVNAGKLRPLATLSRRDAEIVCGGEISALRHSTVSIESVLEIWDIRSEAETRGRKSGRY
jgi:hypothetical protein